MFFVPFSLTLHCVFDRLWTHGRMPEWLGRGLQNLLQEFDSPSDLQKVCRASGGIGRRGGLKIRCPSPDLRVRVPPCPQRKFFRETLSRGYIVKKYPCHCKRCRTRRTFSKHPEFYRRNPTCPCGGTYTVDIFRRKKEHRKYRCLCGELPFPHRRGCKWCFHYRGKYDLSRDIHPFLGPMNEYFPE